MTIPPQLDKRRLAASVSRHNTPAERHRAVRHVASNAHDTNDCAQLLAMLGLSATDVRCPANVSARPDTADSSPDMSAPLSAMSGPEVTA